MTPLVITPCDTIEHERAEWSATPASYLAALAHVGCLPVQCPTVSEPIDPAPLLDVAAGVLVTGARSNVHPALYGMAPSEAAAPHDVDRDRTSLGLIRAALSRGMPLLAICRGIQELNVALGGTLHHTVAAVPGRFDHHVMPSGDESLFALRHHVSVTPGGPLAGIVGDGPVTVNSVHRQGIDRLGSGLVVDAVAEDGTIEAVHVDGAGFALGVQWHPEHFARTDPPSRAIFAAFADACRAYAAEHRWKPRVA